MRIGFDATVLYGNWGGVRWSVARLLRALQNADTSNEYIVYVGRRTDCLLEPSQLWDVRRTFVFSSNRTLRLLWQQFVLPLKAFLGRVDVLHCPASVMPLSSFAPPCVVTVHDLIPLLRPELAPRSRVIHAKGLVSKSVKRAAAVITPSDATKKAVLERFEGPEEKVFTVPFGIGEEFKPAGKEARREVRKRFGLPRRFVLFVGNVEPRKNLVHLIEAFFAAMMSKHLAHSLVVAGQELRGAKAIRRIVSKLAFDSRVHFLGYVPQEHLPALYSAADAFVYPSAAEGFGFPPLEAMACGTPVVISRDEALLETCGEAAIAVEHDDLPGLRKAIERLLLKDTTEIVKKGLERAAEFSWEECAKRTLDVYEFAAASAKSQ